MRTVRLSPDVKCRGVSRLHSVGNANRRGLKCEANSRRFDSLQRCFIQCSEAPASSVVTRRTVNQTSRHGVAIPPPRLCRSLRIERFSVRIEDLSGQRTRNRAGRGLAAASSIDVQSLLHSLPKLARDNRFMARTQPALPLYGPSPERKAVCRSVAAIHSASLRSFILRTGP
jgi:hypothetical protein